MAVNNIDILRLHKYQINLFVSPQTVRHSSPYIITYLVPEWFTCLSLGTPLAIIEVSHRWFK